MVKLLISIAITLLLIIGGVSGYFIWNLNKEIDNLETTLSQSIDEMDKDFDRELESRNEKLNNTINATHSSIDNISETTGQQLTGIESEITLNATNIKILEDKNKANEELLTSSILQAGIIYENVKQAIIRISDGESMVGSGFIVSPEQSVSNNRTNKIITAYHVVEELEDIFVSLYDGRTWKADIWAFSKNADIAILKLKADDPSLLPDMSSLPSVELVDSSSVKAGDPVIVVGSPIDEDLQLGLKESATTGIVSYVARSITVEENRISNLIQFDAATNFGNSGGPVFNVYGKVIGMVVAGISPLIGDGVNFAVAANQISKVETAIISEDPGPHEWQYPWIGITCEDITPEDIIASSNKVTTGAVVNEILDQAEVTDIKVDDIIIKLDSRLVRDSDEFYSYLVEYYSPGDTINLEIRHFGEPVYISLTVKAKPKDS
jgi:S1-C subfamily serine protease